MGDSVGLLKILDFLASQVKLENPPVSDPTPIPEPSPPVYSHLSDCWPDKYWNTDAFLLRLNRALYDLPSYSYTLEDNNSMRIYSESQQRLYLCTFCHCDCEDFYKKNMPCKHMIFLDIKINGIDDFFRRTLGFSACNLDNIQSSGRCVWEIIGRLDVKKPVLSERSPGFNRLIRNGYLTECFHDDLLLAKFTRAELVALIRISGRKPTGSKSDLIPWILSNAPAIIDYCRLKFVFWDIPEEHKKLFYFLHRYSAINNCFPRSDLDVQKN